MELKLEEKKYELAKNLTSKAEYSTVPGASLHVRLRVLRVPGRRKREVVLA